MVSIRKIFILQLYKVAITEGTGCCKKKRNEKKFTVDSQIWLHKFPMLISQIFRNLLNVKQGFFEISHGFWALVAFWISVMHGFYIWVVVFQHSRSYWILVDKISAATLYTRPLDSFVTWPEVPLVTQEIICWVKRSSTSINSISFSSMSSMFLNTFNQAAAQHNLFNLLEISAHCTYQRVHGPLIMVHY